MNGDRASEEVTPNLANAEEAGTASNRRGSIIRLPIKQVKPGETVEYQDVDLSKELTRLQYEILVQEALQTYEQDAEEYLKKVQARLERVGMRAPSAEVRFKDLYVQTEVYADLSRNLPSVLGFYRECIEYILQKLYILRPDKRKLVILDHVNGVIKPGRATLLLGPPASGKSTLLKALAGTLEHAGLEHEGDITYNGRHFNEFIPLRTAAYVEQSDTHIGEMTVRETFDFAARCQGAGSRTEVLEEVRKREREMGIEPDWNVDALMKAETLEGQKTSVSTEFIIRMLGLGICSDTMVGDEMHRGVSGGQKKRVTTGEMIVGPKRVLFMDEISTGLDSSTTYQIVKYLRDLAHTQQNTMLISLLQPAPESYELFDDVLLVAEGHVIYHGPVGVAADYFEAIGFKCPERKGVADFLQEVTSRKDQEQYWHSQNQPYKPVSPKQFSELFKASKIGQEELQHLDSAFEPQAQAFDDAALNKTPYALNSIGTYKACWDREFILVKRNLPLYIFRFFNTMLIGIVTAFTFFRTRLSPTSIEEGNLYFSVVFFSLIMIMFDGTTEINLGVLRLPGFYKQRDSRFYPSWAFVFPTTVLRLPYSFICGLVWSAVVYYVTGLAPEWDRFLYFILMLFSIHTIAIAGLARDESIAITFGSFFFLVLLMLGGFLLGQAQIPAWWIWFYWGLNPLSYAQKGMAVNEFRAPRWQRIFASGDLTIGDAILQQRGLPRNGYNRALGFCVLVFAWIVYNLCTWVFYAFLSALEKPTAVLPKAMQEEIAAEMAAKKGKGLFKGGSNKSMNAVHPDGNTGPASRKSLKGFSQKTLGSPRADGAQVSNRNAPNSFRRGGTPEPDSVNVEFEEPVNGNAHKPTGIVEFDQDDAVLDKQLANLRSQDAKQTGRLSGSGRLHVAPIVSHRLSQRSGGTSEVIDKGMVLPFEPLALTFKDINYYVPMPAAMDTTDPEKIGPKPAEVDGVTMLHLLQSCSGAFQPGILTALVGSSGAGKTTLMDVLAGRKTSGKYTGDVRISGHPKEQASFARVSGYVEQFDIHSPFTTVGEALWISARLRFDNTVDDETVSLFIAEIEELVELEALRASLVGIPGKDGLSVEQRKRLTIAVELVANPSIIFMDEPTSGLDARAAAIVMRTVRNTVDTGRTVVCTIHQPSIDIFEAFDDLLLMKVGGYIIYHGPLGRNSTELVKYFEALPGVPKLKEGLNPATWMLQISTPGMEKSIGIDFADAYKQSEVFRGLEATIDRLSIPKEGSKPLHFDSLYAQPVTKQYIELLKRNFISYSRNQAYNGTRFIFGTVLALLFGSILWQLGDKRSTIQDLSNILGALYLAMLFLAFINSMSVQKVVAYERSVSYRETAAGMYSNLPFALAACSVEVPYILAQDILFCTISYFMIGFETSVSKFFWYLFIIFLTLFLMTNYGIMSVYATPSLVIASVASSMFFGLWNLYAGFIIPRNRMPPWFQWYAWFNPIYWCLYGIITSQLGNVDEEVNLGPGVPTQTVRKFLEGQYGYKYSFLPYACVILIGYGLTFAVIAVFALQKFRFQKR